jgi:hypothetical protein
MILASARCLRGEQEAVFLEHPSQMGLVPMGMQHALGGKVLRCQPR